MDTQESLFGWSLTLAGSFVLAYIFKELLLKLSDAVVHIFDRYLTTSIQLDTDKENVVNWLNNAIEHNYRGKLRHFGVERDMIFPSRSPIDCSPSASDTAEKEKPKEGNTVATLRKYFSPLASNQRLYFFYQRTLISVTRKPIRQNVSFTRTADQYMITAFGTTNRKLLIEMLDEGRKRLEKKPSKRITYYKARFQSGCPSWLKIREFQPRALESIVLKDGVTNDIQRDLADFVASREWYKERGIPYRRGYLLYGPPGCGKTSFVKAIAGQIGYDIHEVQLSNQNLTDESLNTLMGAISKKAILLFEDIDAAFTARVQDEANSDETDGISGKLKIREAKGSLSFSGLLNAIDGVASEEDYVVFMTTNRIEKLDTALIRPGRIDMRQLIDYPDERQIAAFFRKFYPGSDEGVAEKFAKAVTNLKCNPSVAQIQGIFLNHKHTPEDNLKDVDTLVEVCKSNKELGHIYL